AHLPTMDARDVQDYAGPDSHVARRAYFRRGRDEIGHARPSVTEAAAQISEEAGIEATAEDIAAFIRRYPSGVQAYKADVRRARRRIEARLREVTGKPVSEARVQRYASAAFPDAPPSGQSAGRPSTTGPQSTDPEAD